VPKVCRPFSGTSLKTQLNCKTEERESQMAKYKFNDDIPAEEATATIRAVERYANAAGYVDAGIVLAILGIEEVEGKNNEE
jgi:hypothetical protein